MSTEQNKAIAERIRKEIFEQDNLAVIDELVAPDYVDHTNDIHGRDGFKQMIIDMKTAFPDVRWTFHNVIAEGDKVVLHFTQHCTHTGKLVWWNIPPTGKKISVTGIVIDRIEDGKLAERWLNMDVLGMLQQLGVVSAIGDA